MKTKETESSKRARKRVCLIEPHCTTRDGVKRFLKLQGEFLVCGEAETFQKGLACLETVRPDILIMGLAFPDGNAFQFIQDVHSQFPDTGVLVFSSGDEAIYAERCLRCGARGYVMKTEKNETLLKALRQVASGNIYLSASMCTRFFASPTPRAGVQEWTLGSLTNREFEIFESIGQGLTTKQIAERLRMSPKTVETHRTHLKEKLRLKSRPELMTYAVRWITTRGAS
jgi:DNA-binding NarL/FixJ family response regulator